MPGYTAKGRNVQSVNGLWGQKQEEFYDKVGDDKRTLDDNAKHINLILWNIFASGQNTEFTKPDGEDSAPQRKSYDAKPEVKPRVVRSTAPRRRSNGDPWYESTTV